MTGNKLLLVSANRYTVPYPVYPLGISYLLSYLKERLTGFEIRIFDFNLQSEEDFIACLKQFHPDYTCVSIRNVDDVNSMSREFFLTEYKKIISLVKETTDTTLIIGGSAFSIFPEKLFEYFNPAFGIYGRDVQDAGDTSIPEDVATKLLRFARAGLAVALMRGKSYLSMGGTSMGIAGHWSKPG